MALPPQIIPAALELGRRFINYFDEPQVGPSIFAQFASRASQRDVRLAEPAPAQFPFISPLWPRAIGTTRDPLPTSTPGVRGFLPMNGFDEMGVWGDADPLPAANGGTWFGDIIQDVGRIIPVVRDIQSLFAGETDEGDFGDTLPMPTGEGGMVRTAGPVLAGGIWLGGLLARALGGTAMGAVRVAANGVRFRMNQLWPLVRRYGAVNVAGALGITAGSLGTLLVQADATRGRRRRRRGISASDVKTTRRTIKQLRGLTRMAGLSRSRPRARYYSRGRR